MKKNIFRGLAVGGAMALGVAGMAPAVFAASPSTQMYQANLSSLNDSGTTGTATVKVTGDQVTVTVHTTGASANLPHAQHIHIGGTNTCPTAAQAASEGSMIGGKNVLNTKQAAPQYGAVKVSLTTSGDVSANSALAVKRFPTASKSGVVDYSRTFTLPSGVTASDIAHGVIVQHGVSSLFGDKTKYDGSAKSSLDASLPLEATAPAACGALTAMPSGAPATGSGSTSGIENEGLLIAGGATLVAAGAGLAVSRRLASSRR